MLSRRLASNGLRRIPTDHRRRLNDVCGVGRRRRRRRRHMCHSTAARVFSSGRLVWRLMFPSTACISNTLLTRRRLIPTTFWKSSLRGSFSRRKQTKSSTVVQLHHIKNFPRIAVGNISVIWEFIRRWDTRTWRLLT